ncbi:hypothetical protein CANARDRAFT_206868 [[Candida] arabinofermentans NRRL YB-2248]|uniref:Uncharacterized protein n=1 Tax=[Candida] arabinofermentans NRRL YB-2248 TaxID=983967 RepID=A0A1E4T3Z5_9ASCO|nr:hypothetical protein CANARDRAFT_206868 [[Candida] arabinofermentans NRRL YB-2248]
MECQSLRPLIDDNSNALNPCFISLLFSAFTIGFQFINYSIFIGGLVLVVLPLHIFETCHSIVQTATTLFYWPAHLILLFILFVQQMFGTAEHRPIPDFHQDGSPSSFVSGTLGVLIIISCFIIYLEYAHYQPTDELIEHFIATKQDPYPPNIMSKITFSWMNDLIRTGYENEGLEHEDLPPPPLFVTTEYAAPRLFNNWNKQVEKSKKKNKKPSLLLALAITFGYPVIISLCYDMGDSIISFIQPQLLKYLILFFGREDNPPIIIGFSIALGMFIVSLFETALYNQYFIKTVQAGLGNKAALMQLVYDKSMKLSPQARLERSTGDIVNLMAVDVTRVQELTSYVQTLFSAPTRLVLCLISLHALLGNATWAGIATMFVMMPINTILVKSLRKYHKEQMTLKDERTSLVSEILQNVKSIKLYAWEKPMLERVSEVRNNQELKNLNKIGILSAVVNFAWTCVPFFVSCSTFAIFALTSKTPLTPEIVFPALALFDLLSDPIFAIPALMTALIECGVSLNRLSSFLLAEEIDFDFVKKLPRISKLGDVSLEVTNCTFLWSKELPKYSDNYDEESHVENSKVALKNINYIAKKGELSCIVGRVGTGKSTFLQSLLGELNCQATDLTKHHGIQVSGSIAYCSQVPWILNASVKDNILFGHKFDAEFYQRTIECCQLKPDLEILPDGDDTLVGEKGISLSGGQKARLSLARAIYMRADIYLLDDVLSAVDAHVGQKLIDEVLSSRGVLATKTRILATNSVRVLSESQNISLISDNEISESGTYREVISNKGKLYELIKEFASASQQGDELESEDLEKDGEFEGVKPYGVPIEAAGDETMRLSFNPLQKVQSHTTIRRASISSFKRRPISQDKDSKKRTAQQNEKKEKGKVKWSVYLDYAKACSYTGIFTVAFMVVVTVGLSVSGNYWLKHWAEQNSRSGTNSNVMMYVGIYALFGISSGLFTLIRAMIMWSWCSIRASKKLHNQMATAVLNSPMSFFETTPLGRILNRFSQDMSKIDSALPRVFVAVFNSVIKTLFTLFIIGSNMPLFLIIVAALSAVYIYYQKYYIVTSRDLKRIVSISKSPIFAHIQESLNGAETIRAYGQNGKFLFQNSANIDYNQVSAYCMKSVNRWLSTRLQFIGSIIIFSTSTLALLSLNSKHPISSGLLGLIMSYALRVTSSLSFIVKRSVEIESDVVCCERIFEYCQLEPEAHESAGESLLITPPTDWPQEGSVEFKNFSTKYRANLDPVLKNINVAIKAKEKIGIVGRTGSGKSTFALSIFRIIEPTEGHIEIDSINTSDLKLFDLRRNLSIIPQDAQCINGTIRYNIDPFNQYSEAQIWKCLEMSHLKEHVIKMSKDQGMENEPLECKFSESGLNLSVGQRQLFCLARVLLKSQRSLDPTVNPSRILVLDEATSSVDSQTDKIIQETIRSEFKHLTIVTIAHRLDTILDNDKILLLDSGKVIEFETPETLLKNKDSYFYKLCVDGGYIEES